jgi:hypothetical protein
MSDSRLMLHACALVKTGVDAELPLWDGLGHAFLYNIVLPAFALVEIA